ncbi:MAG: RsmE family RNA methyltransferase [Candidatus Cryptobacteroides sp.]
MELFYSKDIAGDICRLDQDESTHCIRVLRHKSGDIVSVIDGAGNLYECQIEDDSSKGAVARIVKTFPDWGSHPYNLHLAVCPTKNMDRYEWLAEKACEVGLDILSPVFGDHSERKVLKAPRLEKILISAAKQSLKAKIPFLSEPVTVREFVALYKDDDSLKLIAYCFEDETHPRVSIKDVLEKYQGREVVVMIGPEGDFSESEAADAMAAGFIPVHLGTSRLRTETAALTAAEAVYFRYM